MGLSFYEPLSELGNEVHSFLLLGDKANSIFISKKLPALGFLPTPVGSADPCRWWSSGWKLTGASW